MTANLSESEFRLIAMGFGAPLPEVDAACRERCRGLGQPCWADRKPVVAAALGIKEEPQ